MTNRNQNHSKLIYKVYWSIFKVMMQSIKAFYTILYVYTLSSKLYILNATSMYYIVSRAEAMHLYFIPIQYIVSEPIIVFQYIKIDIGFFFVLELNAFSNLQVNVIYCVTFECILMQLILM